MFETREEAAMMPSREYDFTSSNPRELASDFSPVRYGAAFGRFSVIIALLSAFALPTRATADTASVATTPPEPSWSGQVVSTDDLARTIAKQEQTRASAAFGSTRTVSDAPANITKPVSTVSVVAVKPKKKGKTAETPPAVIAVDQVVGSGSNDTVALAPESGSDAGPWAALRKCESGDRYSLNSGNGYYGAYQFAIGTWQRLGFTGYPHEASPAVQDAAAKKLQAKSGWGQWPACARKLGLY